MRYLNLDFDSGDSSSKSANDMKSSQANQEAACVNETTDISNGNSEKEANGSTKLESSLENGSTNKTAETDVENKKTSLGDDDEIDDSNKSNDGAQKRPTLLNPKEPKKSRNDNVQSEKEIRNETEMMKNKENETEMGKSKSSKNDVHIPIRQEKNINSSDIDSEFFIVINFRIFVPPEFEINPKTFRIGIFSNYCNWKEDDATFGNFIRFEF